MPVPKCDTCGAPLDPTEAGQVVTCAFCKARVRVPAEPAEPPAPAPASIALGAPQRSPVRAWDDDQAPLPRSAGASPAVWATLIVAAIATGGLVFTLRSGRASSPSPVAAVSPHAATLKTLGDSETTIERIDTSGLPTPFATFDPIANLGWAQRMAGTWSADARLIRLSVEEMTTDGVIDVTERGTARVTYEFASPGRHAAGVEMARVSSKLVFSAIDLTFKKGALSAIVAGDGWRDLGKHDLAFGCPLTKLLSVWHDQGLPIRDAYSVELTQASATGAFEWASKNWGVRPLSTACEAVK